ncbi:fungal specific transcription factor domain-containing protein [Aspergillus puulaauensis]|uniref:Xylanolytic transcriptional activator regulatory domain-containing protein n=1 Tax=Aspergillus puulaauensis TaxID=1220207 RepID=A0A7R7XPH1_9EURO|nr:uncharacterized protein APUU_50036A [Aspergillus puulaauensis]BCS25325.1 hypothetical protein APUU_50036A [Aspergillus puulaauensis]
MGNTAQRCDTNHGIESMTGAAGTPGTGFFGSSSASVFLEQVRAAINAKVSGYAAVPETRASARVVSAPEEDTANSQRIREYLNYELPSRRNADRLVSRYWEVIHPLYPFLLRQTFDKSYQRIWADCIPIAQRIATSKVYFQRARDLLSLSFWESGSIESVQCLLIMAQYLQSTNDVHQCWMSVGQAVRMAQEMGLHLPEPSWLDQSLQERDLLRRIWHGCILMDRLVAMTLGRPAMVSKTVAEARPYPSITDEELLLQDITVTSASSTEIPPPLAFYIKVLELYAIVDDILTALYMRNDAMRRGRTRPQRADLHNTDMTTVVRLDKDLTNWSNALPLHLQPSRPESRLNDTIRRQSIVCRARLLHAKILLFRPVFSLFCLSDTKPDETDPHPEESLHQWLIIRCSILCLQAAHELIDLIFTNFPRDGTIGSLPSWWYNTFYLYSAATVLLASRLHPRIHDSDSGYINAVSWSHVIQILEAIAPMSGSAQKCAIALEILSVTITLAIEDEPRPSLAPDNSDCGRQLGLGLNDSDVPVHETAELGEAGDLTDINDLLLDMSDMSWLDSIPAYDRLPRD